MKSPKRYTVYTNLLLRDILPLLGISWEHDYINDNYLVVGKDGVVLSCDVVLWSSPKNIIPKRSPKSTTPVYTNKGDFIAYSLFETKHENVRVAQTVTS